MKPQKVEKKIKATVIVEKINLDGIKVLELLRILSNQKKTKWYSSWN